MGTNFYWLQRDGQNYRDVEHGEVKFHIGKRSAAGLYCWDCGVTLCQDGASRVHHSNRDATYYGRTETPWWKECPCCGASRVETFDPWGGTGGVELGFMKSAQVPRKGVGTCASFTWLRMRDKRELQELAQQCSDPVVIDEYGREFTAQQFLDEELAAVAIETQYYGDFS